MVWKLPGFRSTELRFWTVVALGLALFVALASRYIGWPGPYNDECFQTSAGVYLAQPKVQAGFANTWWWTVGDRMILLMSGEYIGAQKAYLLGLTFRLFGCSTVVMRLTMVGAALVGIGFMAAFLRRAFGPMAAVFGVVLLATDPGLIMLSRHDWGPQVLAFTLRMISLYLLARWWKSSRAGWLVGAAAVMGFGVWDKTSFLWFVNAMVATGAFVWWTSARRPVLRVKSVLAAVVVFFVAGAPLWLYNLGHDWITFRLMTEPGQKASFTFLAESFRNRTHALLDLLRGHAVDEWILGERVSGQTLLLEAMAVAVVILGIECVRRRNARLLALPVLLVAFGVQIYSTPRGVWVHHWVGLYPVPQMMVAVAAAVMMEWRRKWLAAVAVAALGMVVFANVGVMRGHYQVMAERRSSLYWNAAIEDVARALPPGQVVQVMDWGPYNPLNLVAGGQARLEEPLWILGDAARPSDKAVALLKDPANVFLFLYELPGKGGSKGRKWFDTVTAREGLAVGWEKTFTDRQGRLVYSLVTVGRRS